MSHAGGARAASGAAIHEDHLMHHSSSRGHHSALNTDDDDSYINPGRARKSNGSNGNGNGNGNGGGGNVMTHSYSGRTMSNPIGLGTAAAITGAPTIARKPRSAAAEARYRNARTVDMVIRAHEARVNESAEQAAIRRAEERPQIYHDCHRWYQRHFHQIALFIACIYPALELFLIWRAALRLKQATVISLSISWGLLSYVVLTMWIIKRWRRWKLQKRHGDTVAAVLIFGVLAAVACAPPWAQGWQGYNFYSHILIESNSCVANVTRNHDAVAFYFPNGVLLDRRYEYVDHETIWDKKTGQNIDKINYVVPIIDNSTIDEDPQLNVWAVNEDGTDITGHPGDLLYSGIRPAGEDAELFTTAIERAAANYNITLPPPPYHFLRPKDPADQKAWYWSLISISGSVALGLYACIFLVIIYPWIRRRCICRVGIVGVGSVQLKEPQTPRGGGNGGNGTNDAEWDGYEQFDDLDNSATSPSSTLGFTRKPTMARIDDDDVASARLTHSPSVSRSHNNRARHRSGSGMDVPMVPSSSFRRATLSVQHQ